MKKNKIKILAGEGSYGSDGFLAVFETNTDQLMWLAFFKSSNPFNKVRVVGNEIYAFSTIGCVWRFDVKDPIRCSVKCNPL